MFYFLLDCRHHGGAPVSLVSRDVGKTLISRALFHKLSSVTTSKIGKNEVSHFTILLCVIKTNLCLIICFSRYYSLLIIN